MFSNIYDWMKNLAFYLVLVTAVLHMIPGEGYKRYIQFFTGLVLILMVTSPILELVGMGIHMDDIYNNQTYREIIEKIHSIEEETSWISEENVEDNNITVEEIQIE